MSNTLENEKKSSERLIDMIRGMSEDEADKILYLVEGWRLGENSPLTSEKKTA